MVKDTVKSLSGQFKFSTCPIKFAKIMLEIRQMCEKDFDQGDKHDQCKSSYESNFGGDSKFKNGLDISSKRRNVAEKIPSVLSESVQCWHLKNTRKFPKKGVPNWIRIVLERRNRAKYRSRKETTHDILRPVMVQRIHALQSSSTHDTTQPDRILRLDASEKIHAPTGKFSKGGGRSEQLISIEIRNSKTGKFNKNSEAKESSVDYPCKSSKQPVKPTHFQTVQKKLEDPNNERSSVKTAVLPRKKPMYFQPFVICSEKPMPNDFLVKLTIPCREPLYYKPVPLHPETPAAQSFLEDKMKQSFTYEYHFAPAPIYPEKLIDPSSEIKPHTSAYPPIYFKSIQVHSEKT